MSEKPKNNTWNGLITLRSVTTPTEILQRKDISHGAKLVYGIIYTRQNGVNGAYPSQRNMAIHLGVSDRMIRIYLRELIETELIKSKRFGRTKNNRYWVCDRIKTSSRDWQGNSSLARNNDSTHSKEEVSNIKAANTGNKKPFWDNYRLTQLDGVWRIKVDGEWKDFAGDPKEIGWR